MPLFEATEDTPTIRSEFELVLDTEIDLTGTLDAAIDYVSPSGTQGRWQATTDQTLVRYMTTTTDITECGNWEFQAYIKLANGQSRHGNRAKIYIEDLIRGDHDEHL